MRELNQFLSKIGFFNILLGKSESGIMGIFLELNHLVIALLLESLVFGNWPHEAIFTVKLEEGK